MKNERYQDVINSLKSLDPVKLGAPYAEAINEAVSLLVSQGERIADLEDKLEKLNATGLTPEEIQFFQSPKMVEICRAILVAASEK